MRLAAQNKMVEAEISLLLLTTSKTIGDEDRVHALQASHLLAHLYLRDRQFDKANEFYRKAMIGRRQFLGIEHQSHYETLSLLSAIYKCRGDLMEAETYKGIIPIPIFQDLVPFISVTGDIDFPNPSHEYQEPSRSSLPGVTEEASFHETSTTVETPFVGEAEDNLEVTNVPASSTLSEEDIQLSQSRSPDTDTTNSSVRTSNLHSEPFCDVRPSEDDINLKISILGKSGNYSKPPIDPYSIGLLASSSLTPRLVEGNTTLHAAVVEGGLNCTLPHWVTECVSVLRLGIKKETWRCTLQPNVIRL